MRPSLGLTASSPKFVLAGGAMISMSTLHPGLAIPSIFSSYAAETPLRPFNVGPHPPSERRLTVTNRESCPKETLYANAAAESRHYHRRPSLRAGNNNRDKLH